MVKMVISLKQFSFFFQKNEILILCSLALTVIAIDYLKLIEENFDEHIGPCDNLYRYVCIINSSRIRDVIFEEYEKEVDMFEIPSKYINMKNQLDLMQKEKHIKTGKVSDSLMTKIVETLEKLCLNDHDEYARIITNLSSLIPLFPFNSFLLFEDCHDAALTLNVTLPKTFMRFDPSYEFSMILDTINKFKWLQWLENNSNKYERLKNTVTTIKSFASQRLLTTPWIKNKNYTKLYSTALNEMYLGDPLKAKEKNELYLDEYSAKVQECLERLNSSFLTPICYTFALHQLVHQPDTFMHNKYDAMNVRPYMEISSPYIHFSALNLPPAFFLGSVAFVLAHEIGHSYIVSSRGDTNLPYFPNKTRSCIQNQFENSCQFFAEGECKTADNQFDENGADVFAYEIMYEILKFVFGENINNIPTSSKSNDPHHVIVIRINSVAAQNLEFEDYFNCPKNSKMVESRTEKCYVLGENAPITK